MSLCVFISSALWLCCGCAALNVLPFVSLSASLSLCVCVCTCTVVPESIGNLTALTMLLLHNNQIRGELLQREGCGEG